MKEKIISGIQQIGIGVGNLREAWKWYREHFGMDIRVFEENAVADLMLPYTGGQPQSRHAALGIYPGMGAGAFWASGATGVTPADHGRYFFLQFNPKTYDVAPFHERHTYRRQPFWEDLDEQGRRVAVIDWHRAVREFFRTEPKGGRMDTNFVHADETRLMTCRLSRPCRNRSVGLFGASPTTELSAD